MDEQVDAPEIAPEVIERAQRMGWRPKEEYRGPEDRWIPADKFIEKGESELPILRDRLRALDDRYVKEVTGLKGELGEVKQVLTEFREFSKSAEQRAYERAKKELETRRDEAVRSADPDTFKALDQELRDLEKSAPREPEKKEEKKQAEPTVSEDVSRWIKENPWFEADAELREIASVLHGHNLQRGISERASLEKLTDDIKRRFPDKFDDGDDDDGDDEPRRRKPAPVAAPSGNRRRGKGRTFDDMPPDERAAALASYNKFAKMMPGYTKTEYLASYDWSEDR